MANEYDYYGSTEPLGPGPYLAEVTNHLDPTYMGGLEVALIKDIGPTTVYSRPGTHTVYYMSPFYGVTSARFEGNNSEDFNDVQKSYGWWGIPPDVGTRVMVIFPVGAGVGYWIGCVPDKFQNHMVPGIAASLSASMTSDQLDKYGTKYVPVAEFNKKTNKGENQNISTYPRPVHPFTDRLLAQGLLVDTIRGVTSSSARREIPSSVFGISTPGPLDPNGKKGKVGYEGNTQVPVSRLGGSTFVMDDGDQKGLNELVRIRTRTGHQILLHNSADLIYIANAKGTAWLELTSQGKIDVFAADSVSIHTKGDFNFRADRDFNLEAGRNFNISATKDFNLNVVKTTNIITDTVKASVVSNFNLSASGSIILSAKGNISTVAGAENKHVANGKLSLSGESIAVGTNGELSVSGGSIVAAGGKIDLNGSTPATPSSADETVQPTPLNLFKNPQRDPSKPWRGGNFYKDDDLLSIMQRIPSHEPWDQHESGNPINYTLEKTDSEITPSTTAENGSVTPTRPSANSPQGPKAGPASDRGSVRGQSNPWSTDQAFLDKVKSVAAKRGLDPYDLLAAMHLETNGTMDPSIKNPNSSATGLIQFMEKTAGGLGTNTATLSQLSRTEQLDYVDKYFKDAGWPNTSQPNPTLANTYLTIFYPAAKFGNQNDIVASLSDPKTSDAYNKNDGFDPGRKKGYFTVGMIDEAVQSHASAVKSILNKAGVNLYSP